jgi:hypothetical protein
MRRVLAGLGFAGAALLLLQAPACSSSGGPASDGGSNPPAQVCLALDAGLPLVAAWQGVDAGPEGEPLERFTEDFYEAFCDGISRCAPFASYLISNCLEQLRSTGVYSGVTECGPDAIGLACEVTSYDLTEVATHVQAVGTGLSYDPQSAAACLAAPWTACWTWETQAVQPQACDSVFAGLIPDGGACQFNVECIDGTCVSAGEMCGGTCAPPSPPVGAYAGGRFCAYGAGCANGGLCDGVTCRGSLQAGDNCAEVGYFGCAPGLFCDNTGTCQLQVVQGGTCLYDPKQDNVFVGPDLRGLCQPGLVCQGEALLSDGGLLPGTCEPPARIGEACAELANDEVKHVSGCVLGAVCSCGVCVPPPTSGRCADGLTPCLPFVSACDYVDEGTCVAVSSYGSCSNGQQCTTGYCQESTCTQAPGEACPF